eukprot:TRINITY_DN16846_c0_g4_i1.p1 TRINITY_DN16846_c0_g4~~TRINITY_DN16846_c0_g4_i1.p1  ORF type:complete len:443 (+),score=73.75 TRINITY_DN16846_c0_g4_i1:143-1471(+)
MSNDRADSKQYTAGVALEDPRGEATPIDKTAKRALLIKYFQKNALKSKDRQSRAQTWLEKQLNGLSEIFFQMINVLLIFVPLGIWSGAQDYGSLPKFGFNFLAIVPLAGLLGSTTEAIAAHTGQMIGGLLNATFGNAVEMIITVNAIRAGMTEVVQFSLIGSILSNLLLVLGMAFVASGFTIKTAGFNTLGAGTNVTCLVLASLALVLPTVFNYMPDAKEEDTLVMSRICSIVLGLIYVLFLIFQLRTHAEFFAGEDEEDEPQVSAWLACIVLFLITGAVSCCSEILVDSIEAVSNEWGLPFAFIGIILLPIVGNAAEHFTAVTVAVKGKMDLAVGVAVGSATQIALFVVPFSVIVGWFVDVPMTLDFHIFIATVFVLSVFIAYSVLSDGATNWFEGSMLIGTYIIVAIITWFLPATADSKARSLSSVLGPSIAPSASSILV